MSFGRLQRGPQPHHFWQGRPGVWREVLPAAEARAIAGSVAVAPDLAALGSGCDPDPALDAVTADRNWHRPTGRGADRPATGPLDPEARISVKPPARPAGGRLRPRPPVGRLSHPLAVSRAVR